MAKAKDEATGHEPPGEPSERLEARFTSKRLWGNGNYRGKDMFRPDAVRAYLREGDIELFEPTPPGRKENMVPVEIPREELLEQVADIFMELERWRANLGMSESTVRLRYGNSRWKAYMRLAELLGGATS